MLKAEVFREMWGGSGVVHRQLSNNLPGGLWLSPRPAETLWLQGDVKNIKTKAIQYVQLTEWPKAKIWLYDNFDYGIDILVIQNIY